MGVNKVEYGSNTLVDLTGDTVTPEALLRGITAHNAAGNQIVGTGSGGGGGSMEDTEDLIKRTVGWVGKNLFAISDDYSTAGYGVTKIMDREAGTVTLNGTATADHSFALWFDADETHYTTKAYTLSELGLDLEKSYKIIVENASINCYFTISDYRSSGRYLEITDSDPVTFTFAELGVTSTTKLMCHVRIVQNATFNNTVIKVMITESQYTDEFEPNHPPATEYFPRFIVCETEAEWDALSQAEKDDPNIYWVRPWADTVAFATDKTPVGAVLSVATAKDGEVTDPVIHTPSGAFPTDDYLVCNGQSVPLNKYPALAKYFEDNFGSADYFTTPPYVSGYFSLPNWSSDFPSNGVLVMKALESSNIITFAEIDDTSVSEDKLWSSEKIDGEIDKVTGDGDYVSVNSYAELKTVLTNKRDTMTIYTVETMFIKINTAFTEFPTAIVYQVDIARIGTNNLSAVFTNILNDVKHVCLYSNTWTIDDYGRTIRTSVTPSSGSNITTGSFRLSKIGKTVSGTLNIEAMSNTVGSNTALFIIPEGYRPDTTAVDLGVLYWADGQTAPHMYSGYITIDTSGNVKQGISPSTFKGKVMSWFTYTTK